MIDHGLLGRHLAMIAEVLVPFAEAIESVGLFGSRATGTQKPGSDINLVLYGPLTEPMVDRLWTRFLESLLPFPVDVVAYSLITEPALKKQIDAVMRPLMVREDLIRRRPKCY
jgi:predicted nucleotidyltransferase